MMSLEVGSSNSTDPPPSPELMGRVPQTPGTGDTHTQRDTRGVCSATGAATHQGGPWDQAHTRQLRQEQETRGEKTSPEPPQGTLEPGLGSQQVWGSCCAVCGAVQDKWHHPHLQLGSGDSLDLLGSICCSPSFPKHQSWCDALTKARRMFQHPRELCRGADSSQQPWTSTKDPLQPLLLS